jgi:hypothetical protein
VRLALVLVVVLLLAGCGSDDGAGTKPPPVTPAVNDWADAVDAFKLGLQQCVRQAQPTKGY